MNGEMYLVNGTTCSVTVRHSPAPSAICNLFSSTRLTANVQTVAGMVSLLNDYLISHNKRPLGLLNDMLCLLSNQELKGINDVALGDNPGWGTDGFQANIGCDPVRAACFFSESFSTFM